MQEEKLAINVVFTFQVKAVSGMYVYTREPSVRAYSILFTFVFICMHRLWYTTTLSSA